MPVTPREALGDKPKALRLQLADLKDKIDAVLKRTFTGANSVTFNVPIGLDEWVLKQLLLAYRAAHWLVKHETHDDPRGESWATLTFSPSTPIPMDEERDPGYPGR